MQDPTKKSVQWVELLGQPLSRKTVFKSLLIDMVTSWHKLFEMDDSMVWFVLISVYGTLVAQYTNTIVLVCNVGFVGQL